MNVYIQIKLVLKNWIYQMDKTKLFKRTPSICYVFLNLYFSRLFALTIYKNVENHKNKKG